MIACRIVDTIIDPGMPLSSCCVFVELANIAKVSQLTLAKVNLTFTFRTYIRTLMVVAAMKGADQHISEQFRVQCLESNQRPSDNKPLALPPEPQSPYNWHSSRVIEIKGQKSVLALIVDVHYIVIRFPPKMAAM